jgi:sugar (pentulose or hexulose) kinase
MKNVIAIFDIGKTNKKFLLFDQSMKLVFQHEVKFDEIIDDDSFACDDIDKLETWIQKRLSETILAGEFNIKAINFSTYGASLVYLDENGKRLTPVYNYLKPMPNGVLDGFYEKHGDVDEFSRATASPAMGMLNSGLQIRWLKITKPEIFSKVKTILHFPQYISYLMSGKTVSEFTSIGCHTAMWDFDQNRYHQWLADESIKLPEPISNSTLFDVDIEGHKTKVGIGIHDSSASLVPYFMASKEPFILISTGTWCIFMNPFNSEPLTADQLKKDSLCYMSIQQKQVKSSRLFMGHIHDVNVKRISEYFGVSEKHFQQVKVNGALIDSYINSGKKVFFENGIPSDFTDITVDLSQFSTFDEAYHRFLFDLVKVGMDSLRLIIPKNDNSRLVYVSGGFARNQKFLTMLQKLLPDKKVIASEIDNASALGAALIIWEAAFGQQIPEIEMK